MQAGQGVRSLGWGPVALGLSLGSCRSQQGGWGQGLLQGQGLVAQVLQTQGLQGQGLLTQSLQAQGLVAQSLQTQGLLAQSLLALPGSPRALPPALGTPQGQQSPLQAGRS